MNGFIVLLAIAVVCFVVVILATVKKNDALNKTCITMFGSVMTGAAVGELIWNL